jgi:hypothetical protein
LFIYEQVLQFLAIIVLLLPHDTEYNSIPLSIAYPVELYVPTFILIVVLYGVAGFDINPWMESEICLLIICVLLGIIFMYNMLPSVELLHVPIAHCRVEYKEYEFVVSNYSWM